MRLKQLSLLDQIVLALVVEQPRHGFAVAAEISNDEALALAISVRRALVYRAIDDLRRASLVAAQRRETGQRGSPRVVWRATARGKRVSRAWLDEVVEHPRDARLELLAKFALRARRGLSLRKLATAQRQRFEPLATALRRNRRDETSAAALVRRWRYESVAAMVGLLRDLESHEFESKRVKRGGASG